MAEATESEEGISPTFKQFWFHAFIKLYILIVAWEGLLITNGHNDLPIPKMEAKDEIKKLILKVFDFRLIEYMRITLLLPELLFLIINLKQ